MSKMLDVADNNDVQCSLKFKRTEYNDTPSPVYDDCACGSGVPPNTQAVISTWCFSPSGQECNWYADCLEKRRRCEGTDSAYAITFADKFCNLYKDHYQRFSQIGQNWIYAVRKCLQVVLVPILRPGVNITCDGIKQMAFSSHADCYISPYPGAPSVCNISITDFYYMFWTIKSAFKDAFDASVEGANDVYNRCCGYKHLINMIKIELNALDDLAGAVADAMGSKLRWTDAGVMWFAYSNSSTSSDTVPVYVLITGKSTYNLNNIQGTNVNLTAVNERVMKAVQDGVLSFSSIGKASEPIYVKQMKECIDFACLKTTNNVTAPEKVVTKNSASEQMGHCLQITYSILLILIILAL
ncbi:hypothetical protein ACJMK2_029702 [Sinanodonta woodiana]|uniref:Uncharacterized protein n=1 Tax=Sinanodonta woodiana TaxID=1069815 RepID=A0ABD3XAZ7_SINWO